MSWFRFAGPSEGGSNRPSIWERVFSRKSSRSRKGARPHRRGFDQRDCRLLRVDELEARCLLSVTPADLTAIVVNQTYGAAQTTLTAHSVASDNNNDFVVTWTRTDSYTVANGTTYPVNNVYARYYTDTVDQVNLPTSLLTTTSGSTQPSFSLRYNDQTIEQISVTGGVAPTGDPNAYTSCPSRVPLPCITMQLGTIPQVRAIRRL